MTFIIHYMVRTALKDLNFDIVSASPVTRSSLDSLRQALARDAALKINRDVFAEDIVIANIIPIPSGEAKEIGGS